MSVHRDHSLHRRQAEARHAQSLGRFTAKREELAALFDIELVADPPPAPEIFEPVRGERFAFDVSCMVCGVVARFDRAPTFAMLAHRMEMARWRVGVSSRHWRGRHEALHDLRAYRACSECASEVT